MSGRGFKEITPDMCIYKNLREWMNIHKINRAELTRRCCEGTSNEVYRILLGKYSPSKHFIDKLIAVTGLTYEVLFEEDESENQ